MSLEEMGSFFDSRIDSYEAYMLREGNPIYAEVGQLIPDTPGLKLLDLGCGTGLELDEIFRVNPMVQVTGVDIAEKLLKKLSQKHATRKNQLNLIKADYLKYDFKKNAFNIVISVQTLHHFPREEKVILYKKVFAALLPDGFYIESDYYAPDRAFQDFRLA
jgi:tRNA (cmo5U34)-methyltransferase